ncbi:Vacuolar protein sorting-associated protein 70 [Dimargaris verticillata]|uniref:Vacuolar protein sorting-associated protein 70 n=1 Tax=Dimargaris verticillata TaxID=2761393 RepID=A0A9W8B3H2_9FUNG|nr:Vacuolar protein sorting-associated protein 70 [Dimargaris verticillata]
MGKLARPLLKEGEEKERVVLYSSQQRWRYHHHRSWRASQIVVGALIALLTLWVCAPWRWWNAATGPTVRPFDAEAPFDPFELFQMLPEPANLKSYLHYYASGPHMAGVNETQAHWTRKQMHNFGLTDVEIVEYEPLLSYPRYQEVAIVSPESHRFQADLHEPVVDEDDTSRLQDNIPPAFHGYAASGNVTARVVYANYGRKEDFEALVRHRVPIEGNIVLVRYGQNFRGIKVALAQSHGAVGVLIYSDPADDGYGVGTPYPEGPFRPAYSVQRGSVQNLAIYPGDPLTPGRPATPGMDRQPREDANNLPKIPSIPLSYQNAQPILQALAHHGIPATEMGKDWRGALNITYTTGPSQAEVRLVNQMNEKITPIWNVVARIEGWEEPNQAVIIGGHRDAWVFGAADPGSGSAVLLELARGLGVLLQSGWRPRRTIYVCSWDGEEYGLTGSTEWVEENLGWLRDEAIAYINVDMAVSGSNFMAGASPSLAALLYDVTRNVSMPYSEGQSVYDHWASAGTTAPGTISMVDRSHSMLLLRNDAQGTKEPPVFPLGTGSDFTAFLDYAGIASMDMGFGGAAGTYHSAYDSIHWMEKFIDPDYLYHQAMTRIIGGLGLKLADDSLLGMDLARYAKDLEGYVVDLEVAMHRKLAHGSSQSRLFQPPSLEPVTDFKPLYRSVGQLQAAAKYVTRGIAEFYTRYGGHCDRGTKKGKAYRRCLRLRTRLNDKMRGFERLFLNMAGLPSRPWYKHMVVAPGRWTGYGAQPLPALHEALEEDDWRQFAMLKHEMTAMIGEAAKFVQQ